MPLMELTEKELILLKQWINEEINMEDFKEEFERMASKLENKLNRIGELK